MSGLLDDRMRELALKMLSKYGKKGKIVSNQKGYDSNTGQTIDISSINQDIHFFVDSHRTNELRQSSIIEKNESIILISAKECEIEAQYKIESDTINTTIISFISVWSGEEVALYEAVAVV